MRTSVFVGGSGVGVGEVTATWVAVAVAAVVGGAVVAAAVALGAASAVSPVTGLHPNMPTAPTEDIATPTTVRVCIGT
jgi:hypothetical protein